MKEKGGGGVDGYVMGLSLVYKFVLLLLFWPGNSFNDVERCVCAGYDNGDIKLFDLRTMTVRWEGNVKNGVSYLMEGHIVLWTGFVICTAQLLQTNASTC